MRELKTFDYSNNYIQEKIYELTGVKTEKMGYDEYCTTYYYWYDIDAYNKICTKESEIQNMVEKLESKDSIMIGISKAKDEFILIVGIDNRNQFLNN